MTAKNAVADDVLGRITRKFMDLLRRTLEGSANAARVSFFLQRAIENPPNAWRPGRNECAVYILESSWRDCRNDYEFATITMASCHEGALFFEDLLREDLTSDNRKYLMKRLEPAFSQFTHGSSFVRWRVLRLYRVSSRNCFGDSEGVLTRTLTDIHFTLKPICEFTGHGPVPVGTH